MTTDVVKRAKFTIGTTYDEQRMWARLYRDEVPRISHILNKSAEVPYFPEQLFLLAFKPLRRYIGFDRKMPLFSS